MSSSGTARLSRQTLGILEMLLEDPTRPAYGFELMTQVGVKSGTLYPILARLEREGLLRSEWEEGEPEALGRPRRRYYILTAAGHAFAVDAMQAGQRRESSRRRRLKPLAPAPNPRLG